MLIDPPSELDCPSEEEDGYGTDPWEVGIEAPAEGELVAAEADMPEDGEALDDAGSDGAAVLEGIIIDEDDGLDGAGDKAFVLDIIGLLLDETSCEDVDNGCAGIEELVYRADEREDEERMVLDEGPSIVTIMHTVSHDPTCSHMLRLCNNNACGMCVAQ